MNNDSKSSMGLLEQAEQAMHRLAIPQGPPEKLVNELLSRMDSLTIRQSTRTSIWTFKTRAIVALPVLAATVVFVMFQFPSNSFALNELTQAIHKVKTLTYQVVLNKVNIDSKSTTSSGQWKMFYKDPGRSRTEHRDGMVSVTDLSKKQITTLVPAIKQVTTIDLSVANLGQETPEVSFSTFPIGLLEQGLSSGKSIADKTIDGKVVKGFEVQAGAVTLSVWGDPTTKLPVLIEQKMHLGDDAFVMTMKDFEFGVDLSDELFSLAVPAGYALQNGASPMVDLSKVNQPSEIHAVNILRVYAARFDGKFPKQIDDPALIATLGMSYASDVEEYKKVLAELTPSIGASWTFRTTLDKFGYSGAAKLGDADKIVFWYLPTGAKQFRVVYGDLRIGDVDADQLPKVAK